MTNTNTFSPVAAFWACFATFALITVNNAVFAAQITTIA